MKIDESRDLRIWSWAVVAMGAALVGFSIAHVLEDFVHGVPRRLGFEPAIAALLLGLGYALHVLFIAWAARLRLAGYLGNLAVGLLWFLAATVEHYADLFTTPYRAGFLSKFFLLGLLGAAVLLAAVALGAWRARQRVVRL